MTGLLAAALVAGGGAASAQQYPPNTPPGNNTGTIGGPDASSPSPSPSASNNVGGIGGGDPAPPGGPGGATSPSPSASPSGGNAVGCLRAAEVVLDRDTILAGSSTGMTVTATPNSVIDVFAYTQPSREYRIVRPNVQLGGSGVAQFVINPPANTRLYAQQRGCAFGRSKVLNVRTTLSLTVRRDAKQTYTFMGDSLPARRGGLIVSIYRVTPDGRQILSNQARTSEVDGEWALVRRFTGTGRFGFVVRTGQDIMNAPGTSNVRTFTIF